MLAKMKKDVNTSSEMVSLIVTGLLFVQLTFIALVLLTFGLRLSLMELAVDHVPFCPAFAGCYLTQGRCHSQIVISSSCSPKFPQVILSYEFFMIQMNFLVMP